MKSPSAPTGTPNSVPLCDIQAQYRALKEEIDTAVLRVLGSGQAILGPEVTAFEQETATFCGAQFGVGCGSGTDALVLALRALDIGPGDEVIVPPFTFFATVSAVCRIGATPVFVDIDPTTFNIDPNQIEAKITPKTRAIIPVHLFGQCCDMDAIWEIAEEHHLYVLEDARILRQRVQGEAVRHSRHCSVPELLPHEEPRRAGRRGTGDDQRPERG